MAWWPRFIPQHGLDALKDYKYSAEDHSILTKLFLKRFWDWVVTLFPMWVAPNVMTFGGFLLLVSNFLGAYYFCPQVTGCAGDPPNWFFIVVALNLWVYQTLDNIDGKQARRTGSSSPLGELFDHGCDSLFLLLTGMPWFLAMKMSNWQAFLFLTQGTMAFYAAHWEEYHSHKLILGLIANPTEVQYWIMSVFVATGLLGTGFWQLKLHQIVPAVVVETVVGSGIVSADFFAQSQGEFILLVVWFGIGFALVFNGLEAWKYAIKNGEGFFAPIRTFAPYAFQVAILSAWASWSHWNVIDQQPWMFLTMHGLLFSYLCDQIMLARICKLPFNAFNKILIIPLLGALNVCPLLPAPLVPEPYVMPVIFGALAVIYVYFIISVVIQFATHLKINVFTIPYRPHVKTN